MFCKVFRIFGDFSVFVKKERDFLPERIAKKSAPEGNCGLLLDKNGVSGYNILTLQYVSERFRASGAMWYF